MGDSPKPKRGTKTTIRIGTVVVYEYDTSLPHLLSSCVENGELKYYQVFEANKGWQSIPSEDDLKMIIADIENALSGAKELLTEIYGK